MAEPAMNPPGDSTLGPGRRRPAAVLLGAGIGSLLVSVFVGFGVLSPVVTALDGSPLDWRWVVVAVTVVVGSVLVLGTGRRRDQR